MHYCYPHASDADILKDILRTSIPEEALTCSACWKRICQVRGKNFSKVDPEDWREICGRRGYVHGRENPRGF